MEFVNCYLATYLRVCLIAVLIFIVKMPVGGYAEGVQLPSKWDQDFLNVQFQGVRIKPSTMTDAWQQIGKKYLLRANFYMDVVPDSDSVEFTFDKETATGKELIEAFLATYPTYTFTQDRETGVIWIHPKRIKYENILNQKIRIDRPAFQVRALNTVVAPLTRMLSMTMPEWMRPGPTLNYGVDLPAGVYTVKEIINFCCVANPSKAFEFFPGYEGGALIVNLDNLYFNSPLTPPRAEAVRFWEIEIGKSTNGIPVAAEVGAAMSDSNPRKRWAARCYFEAAIINYQMSDIVRQSGSPENKVWAALGEEAAIYRGINDPQFLVANVASGFTTNLTQISDPGLALVTSLELAREKQGTNYLYLDTIVSQHKFTEAEVASIKSDVYRLAHESPLALDKLRAIKLDVQEFLPKALDELADTNLFTLVPAEAK